VQRRQRQVREIAAGIAAAQQAASVTYKMQRTRNAVSRPAATVVVSVHIPAVQRSHSRLRCYARHITRRQRSGNVHVGIAVGNISAPARPARRRGTASTAIPQQQRAAVLSQKYARRRKHKRMSAGVTAPACAALAYRQPVHHASRSAKEN